MDRQSVPVSSSITLSQLSLGACCAWSPVRRDSKEDSTRRIHRERRSHAQEKAERVKGIADPEKALQLQLCVVAAASTQGHRRFAAPGEGFLSVQSLCLLGRGRGQSWWQRTGAGPLSPVSLRCGPGAALGSEPAGEIPTGLGALPGAINH